MAPKRPFSSVSSSFNRISFSLVERMFPDRMMIPVSADACIGPVADVAGNGSFVASGDGFTGTTDSGDALPVDGPDGTACAAGVSTGDESVPLPLPTGDACTVAAGI